MIQELIIQISEYESAGRYNDMFTAICQGLAMEPCNYEIYLLLGDYYLLAEGNPEQALLCYRNSLFHCKRQLSQATASPNAGDQQLAGTIAQDQVTIESFIENLYANYQISLNNTSIVIVSYNSYDQMVGCLESIRRSVDLEHNEVVIIDNASADGITEWLSGQDDIVFYPSDENLGFGGGSNKGVELANQSNDIFFLNNDTILTDNALFWLQMTMYQRPGIGACGAYSNYPGNDQSYDNVHGNTSDSIANYLAEAATKCNLPRKLLGNQRIWLSGFALLCKREVLEQTGLFDLDYELGYYEDNDLSMRILSAGYELLACPNSVIYHYGSTSFMKNPERTKRLLATNQAIFRSKWSGIDLNDYSQPALNILNRLADYMTAMVAADVTCSVSVLEIGCKAGTTLNKLQEVARQCGLALVGCEENPVLANIAGVYHDVFLGNLGEYIDYVENAQSVELLKPPFNFVYMEDAERFFGAADASPDEALRYILMIKHILAEGGKFIFTISTSYKPEQIERYLAVCGMNIEIINLINDQDRYIITVENRREL